MGKFVGILGFALLGFSVHAQTVRVPQSYHWQGHPSDVTPDPLVVPIVKVPDCADPPEWGTTLPINTPLRVAQFIAYTLRAEHSKPVESRWIQPDGSNVMILITNFGHQKTEGFECGSRHTADGVKFFRPEDALFNTPGTLIEVWRHPFPRNATTAGELRAWSVEFRTALINVLATMNPPLPSTENPANWRYYFDCEARLTDEHSVQAMRMLQHLHDGQTTIWNTWKVPGSQGWVGWVVGTAANRRGPYRKAQAG